MSDRDFQTWMHRIFLFGIGVKSTLSKLRRQPWRVFLSARLIGRQRSGTLSPGYCKSRGLDYSKCQKLWFYPWQSVRIFASYNKSGIDGWGGSLPALSLSFLEEVIGSHLNFRSHWIPNNIDPWQNKRSWTEYELIGGFWIHIWI